MQGQRFVRRVIPNGIGIIIAKGHDMKGSIARELVEKSGVDAEELVELLVGTAVAELTNYYYYTLLRTRLIGLQGEALKKIIEDARGEDLNHFEALVPRICELGGSVPVDLQHIEQVGEPSIRGTLETNDTRAILECLLKAAEHNVRRYTRICNMTCGKDNRTYTLSLAILHEEIAHQVWFLEFLGHGGTEPIEQRGGSPYVRKFLQEPLRAAPPAQ